MFQKSALNKIRTQGNIILKSRFLSSLSPLQRYEFLRFCHRRKYNEGEYIYYQNDPATGMYFIESGSVQLIVEKDSGATVKGKLTFDLNPPESFGALSIGYDLRRTSSARSLSDCILLGFFKPDFESLKKRHPYIAVKFLETAAGIAMKQLEKTTRKLIEVTDASTAFSIENLSHYKKREEDPI